MTAVVGKPPNTKEGAMVGESGSTTDKLPVVELKPFLSKQWRPCKSIPGSYDNRSLPSSVSTGSPRKAGPGSLISDAEAEVKKLYETPRSNQCHDRNSYTPRKATSIHPKPQTESISIDGEQAFATYSDRQKSTVDEIKNGGSKILFSCFRRAMSDLDLSKQQDIRVQGRKMEDLPPKGRTTYADPWEYYRCDKSCTIPDGSVSQSLPNADTLDNMYLRLENVEYAYMDDSIYDAFDRSSTLPSINVRNAPMKIKRPRTERGLRQPSGKVSQKSAYRLGVANSLDVLSHYGRPIEVEQHLSNQLKRTIQQIKKTKDLSFVNPNILPFNRYGGSVFPPRYDNSVNVSDVSHHNNPDTFVHRERNQKQQILAQRSRTSPCKLNLEGASVVSSHSLGQVDDSKSSIKASRNASKSNEDSFSFGRPNGNRALLASRSSLSSSVPSVAVSARALSMMRAETLPAIAPGSGVLGLKELTSSRSRVLSNSAPEVRAPVMDSPRGLIQDSRTSTGKMPKINEAGPNSSPVSSRSSVSSGIVLQRSEIDLAEEFCENTHDIDPVVVETSECIRDTETKAPSNPEDTMNMQTSVNEETENDRNETAKSNMIEDETPNTDDDKKDNGTLDEHELDVDSKNTMTETNQNEILLERKETQDNEDVTFKAKDESKVLLDENSNELDSVDSKEKETLTVDEKTDDMQEEHVGNDTLQSESDKNEKQEEQTLSSEDERLGDEVAIEEIKKSQPESVVEENCEEVTKECITSEKEGVEVTSETNKEGSPEPVVPEPFVGHNELL